MFFRKKYVHPPTIFWNGAQWWVALKLGLVTVLQDRINFLAPVASQTNLANVVSKLATDSEANPAPVVAEMDSPTSDDEIPVLVGSTDSEDDPAPAVRRRLNDISDEDESDGEYGENWWNIIRQRAAGISDVRHSSKAILRSC